MYHRLTSLQAYDTLAPDMIPIFVLFLFIGMFMVVHGIYDERFRALKDNVRVEYRFVPRTYYEEQLSNTDVSGMFKDMFEKGAPWQERNMGTPSV